MEGYLIHHGVKGQKWGVRRYQNPDGTLTDAGKKKLAKNEKYREKLANKSKYYADTYSKYASDSKEKYDDLRKNGENSETYKNYLSKKDSDRQIEYDSIHGPGAYEYSKERKKNLQIDAMSKVIDITRQLEIHHDDYLNNRELGKRYLNTYENLMNLPVDVATSRLKMLSMYILG